METTLQLSTRFWIPKQDKISPIVIHFLIKDSFSNLLPYVFIESPEAADQDNVYTAFPNTQARSSEVLYEELRPSGVYDTVNAI